MKKLIRYRLAISRTFPATHPRKGEPTFFAEKIKATTEGSFIINFGKIHTIRANYQLWKKRFEKIEKGEAVLELYYWSGKPYNSKCVTICQLSKDDRIGIQIISDFGKITALVRNTLEDLKAPILRLEDIAQNDGLSFEDFKAWFKDYDLSEPLAIIHFTKFRY